MSAIKALAPLLSLALAACQSATGVDQRLAVTISADRAVLHLGDAAVITISMMNRSDREVRMADPRSYACFAPYRVFDEHGQPVALPGRLCSAVAYGRLSLAPGEVAIIRDGWAGNKADGALGATPVPAGEYRIAARLSVDKGEIGSDPITVAVDSTRLSVQAPPSND